MDTQEKSKPGRPPLYSEAMVKRMFTLPQSMLDYLNSIGDGNRSAGLRKVVEQVLTEQTP